MSPGGTKNLVQTAMLACARR